MNIFDRLVLWFMNTFYPVPSTDHSLLQVPITPDVVLDTTPALITPPEPIPSPTAHPSKLEAFCLAIRDYEGGPGNANYTNNNPGNCRCSKVGYLPKYGKVGCSPGGFAVFPTYELGWEYLLNLVHQRAVIHPSWTILQFFQNYSPSADKNDPTAYAKNVATRCGVGITTTLKDLFV